jgi:hypothetical protein
MKKSSIPFILAIYLLMVGLFATYIFFDTLTHNFYFLGAIFANITTALDKSTLITLSFMISGSILGAAILSLKGLHKYAAVQGEFITSYTGSYIIGPWAAALLGLVMYGIIRGGLFVFGGLGSIDSPNEATELGYFGVGFLVGFAWDKTLDKLDSLAGELFSRLKTDEKRDEK